MRAPLLAALLAALIAATGCVLSEVDLSQKACPCAAGYVCDRRTNACLPEGLEPPDAGAPDAPSADASPDASPIDTGSAPDADAGPTDVAEDGGEDAAPDASDVEDTGVHTDALPPDTGPTPCVYDRECGPSPANVCSGGACGLGCHQLGGIPCAVGTCDAVTGHCIDRAQACLTSADCGAGPPSTVCVGGFCNAGCTVASAACGGDRMCDVTRGYCEVALACTVTPDCGDPDFVCDTTNLVCKRRCDRPGAEACHGALGCDGATGLCGDLVLGAACAEDEQCGTGRCVTITNPARSFCTKTCGATSDCPLGFGCLTISGAKACIPESVVGGTVDLVTPSGESCSNPGNTCQSNICGVAPTVCVERCSRPADCAGFSNQCLLHTQAGMGNTIFSDRCLDQAGASVGQGCVDDAACASGICNRYAGRVCAHQCCSDADCSPTESCIVYDLTPAVPTRICQRRSGGAGTAPLGAACTSGAQCDTERCAPRDPDNLAGPRMCTTYCCTDADCAALPGGGRCAPLPGVLNGTLDNTCVSL